MSGPTPASTAASSWPERTLTALLRHPAAMAAKRAVRNAVWRAKGRKLARVAPLPADVRSVLFVCLGNICRSPFAEHRAAQLVTAAGGLAGLRSASAGISTRQAARVPTHGVEVAREHYGLSLESHRPLQLTAALMEAHDLVVVMEASQAVALRNAYPERADRVVLLPEFDPEPVTAYERFHIEDPFLRPRAAFEACYRRIDRAVIRLVEAIAPVA